MRIDLTKEQIEEFKEDGYIDFIWDKNRFYVQVDRTGIFEYAEVSSNFNDEESEHKANVCFGMKELQKMRARKPYDPSWHSNEPLCPTCQANMLYKFEHCPKCGQKLDWSERE